MESTEGFMKKRERVMEAAKAANLRLERVAMVYDFAAEMARKFGTFIKAVVVFGSFARKEESEKSDVDVLVIIDDSFAPLDKALYAAFQAEVNKISQRYPDLHINVVAISSFWDSVRRGDPLAIQVLREGIPVYDLGFFAPLKRLLLAGKIRPTKEAITAAVTRAFANLNTYNASLLSALNALYWAAVEAAHAAVMAYGKVPGSPWEVPELLRATVAKDGGISEEDIGIYLKVFELYKKMSRGELNTVAPQTLEELHKAVVEFVTKLDLWINKRLLKGEVP